MEGYCYDCAKKKGINPNEVLAKQTDILSKDKVNLSDMTKQFETIFKDLAENINLEDIENCIDFIQDEKTLEVSKFYCEEIISFYGNTFTKEEKKKITDTMLNLLVNISDVTTDNKLMIECFSNILYCLFENKVMNVNDMSAMKGVSKDNKVISELPNELRRVFNDAYNLLKTNKATGADGKSIDYSKMYQYIVAKSQVDKQTEASSKLDVIYDRINKLSDKANALKQESKSVLPGKAEEESRKNITNYRKQISDLNKENAQFLNRENLQQELNELERLTDQANINKLEQIKNILSEMGISTADIQTIEQATEAVKELQAAVSGAQQNRQAVMEQVRTAGQSVLENQNSYSMDSYVGQKNEAQKQLQNVEQEQAKAINQRVSQSLESISEAQNDVAQSTENATNAQKRSASVIGDSLERQQQLNSSLEDFKDRIKYFISFQNVLYGVKNAVLQTYNDVVELDEALASIAMVSDYSVEDMWGFYDQYADMAQKMGQNTKDVIQSSALYVQQGWDCSSTYVKGLIY